MSSTYTVTNSHTGKNKQRTSDELFFERERMKRNLASGDDTAVQDGSWQANERAWQEYKTDRAKEEQAREPYTTQQLLASGYFPVSRK